MLGRMLRLVSYVYEIPEDCERYVIIALPEKKGASRCENYD